MMLKGDNKMGLVSSVSILKEVSGYKDNRVFFHDIVVGEGDAYVTAKILKVEDVLVLKSKSDVDIAENELNLIEKLYVALQSLGKSERVRVSINPVELQSALRLNAMEEFKGIDRVIYHMKSTVRLSREELDEWKDKFKEVLDEVTELKDVSTVFKRIYLDDGLTMFNSVIEEVYLNRKGVQEGDVVDVMVMESYITGSEGYIIASKEKGNMVGIEDMYKIEKEDM